MKELLIIHHSGSLGGAGVSLLDIVDSLTSSYNITVVCPNSPKDMVEALLKRPVKIIKTKKIGYLPYYNGGSTTVTSYSSIASFIKIFRDYKAISKIIRDFNGDVVMVNSMTLSWIGRIIKKYNKIGICFHRETYINNKFVGTKLIKSLMKKYFHKIVFISKFDADQTPEVEVKDKIIIYDKVRKEKFIERSPNIKLPIKKILYLGGFSELKGAHLIIKAMKYVKTQEIKLIFIGNPLLNMEKTSSYFRNKGNLKANQYKEKLLNFIEANNLNGKIEFLTPTTNPEELYQQADLVVFPNTLPHQSRPIYEAGFSKTPIIISDFINTQEFIKDDITGFVFKDNDYLDLAKTIDYVLSKSNNELNTVLLNNYNQSVIKNDYQNLETELNELLQNI